MTPSSSTSEPHRNLCPQIHTHTHTISNLLPSLYLYVQRSSRSAIPTPLLTCVTFSVHGYESSEYRCGGSVCFTIVISALLLLHHLLLLMLFSDTSYSCYFHDTSLDFFIATFVGHRDFEHYGQYVDPITVVWSSCLSSKCCLVQLLGSPKCLGTDVIPSFLLHVYRKKKYT